MWIRVQNVWTHVVRADECEESWLAATLTYTPKDYALEQMGIDPTECLLNNGKFPTGLLRLVEKKAFKQGVKIEKIDETHALDYDLSQLGYLRDYQRNAVETALRKRRGIIQASTGCHAKGQGILMASGAVKNVEDVAVGDFVMGDDGTPREVLQLCRGRQQMVRILPKRWEPFVVNTDHMLSLEHTTTGEVMDVTVRGWMSWTKTQKHLFKLRRRHVRHFHREAEALPIDPYSLGFLLGDGSLCRSIGITKPGREALEVANSLAEQFGLKVRTECKPNGCPTHYVTGGQRGGRPNPLKEVLRGLGVTVHAREKFIPEPYKLGNWDTRRGVLAGLLDTDGHLARNCFEACLASRQLRDDIAFVASSLGLRSVKTEKTVKGTTYFRVSISGHTDIIPTRIDRKQATKRNQKKSPLKAGFAIETLPEDDYYGFTLSGNQRYLTSDFTVHHNSGKSVCATAIGQAVPDGKWLFLIHRNHLAKSIQGTFKHFTGEECGFISAGKWDIKRFTAASMQTINASIKKKSVQRFLAEIDGIIVDEVHVAAAKTFKRVIMATTNAGYRVGLSATPLDRSDRRSMLAIAGLGSVIYRVTTQELIERGVLARPRITMLPCTQWSPKSHYQSVYKDLIVKSEVRNNLIVSAVKKAAKPCIVFFNNTAHGKELRKQIEKYYTCDFVDGKSSLQQRQGVVDNLKRGRSDVLVASTVFVEGVDVPDLRSVVMAAAGKSVIRTLQSMGRGMRKTEGKDTFELWDIDDRGHYLLRNHARARRKTYVREGHDVTIDESSAVVSKK